MLHSVLSISIHITHCWEQKRYLIVSPLKVVASIRNIYGLYCVVNEQAKACTLSQMLAVH